MPESQSKQLTFSKRVSDSLRRKEDSSYVATRSGAAGQLPSKLQNKETQIECLKLLYLNHLIMPIIVFLHQVTYMQTSLMILVTIQAQIMI